MSELAVSGLQRSQLFLPWLEEIAVKQARVDAGVRGVALSTIETLVHLTFQYLLFVFYPAYEQFYEEGRVAAFEANGSQVPRYESSLFREGGLFFHRFIANPCDTGSIFPSSRWLVSAITRHVYDRRIAANNDLTPRNYLDIGAGTGPFSQGIIEKMGPGDHLDIVEFDLNFCKLLARKFRHLPNVRVHHISFLDFNPILQYDAITSGLPLNNFPSEFVDRAHAKYIALAKPNAKVSYFEYKWLPDMRRAFMWGEPAANYDRVAASKQQMERTHQAEIDDVYLNMTPAVAVHCSVNA